jgi:hypothetical protein
MQNRLDDRSMDSNSTILLRVVYNEESGILHQVRGRFDDALN